ncbi:hypothetical protein [Sphingomonas sp. BE137]|uniref:hypothetical protein n=1 Tax=Sphingomonas sp. BE137 TaxID=2817844 RepID=UPI001AE2E4DD|nr:hypothetical protein [Sphingomonas sp. BE137]MDR6850159.1 hypothetical protein [Sphingomonas sp. BE137]
MLVTPSNPNPWYGTIREGRRFTEQQNAKLISANKDPLTCESIEVRRNATDREYYWPTGTYPPFFAFDCPVLARMADGRVKVIAPSGQNKIVLKDGWVTRPGRRKSWNPYA